MNLIDIFDNLPKILQYFILGLWTIYIFRWCRSEKERSENITFILSCVVSYILLAVAEIILTRFGWKVSVLARSGIAILLGTIIAVILGIIFNAKWFSKLTVKLFHRTPNTGIWHDVLNLKDGTNLKVYEADKKIVTYGHYRNLEENTEDPWLALSAYQKFPIDVDGADKEEPLEDHGNDNDAIYTVRLSSIEHIEVFNPIDKKGKKKNYVTKR